MNPKVGVGVWLITSPEVAVEPNFKHHHIHLVKPHRKIHVLNLAKVNVKVNPEVKVRSQPLRSRIELRGQVAYQSIRELSASTMVPFATLYLNLIGSY